MNEQDFRNELRRTMATLPARPEMSDTEVLDAARRDLRRRRTMWAGIGSATAVIAVAVGVAVLAPSATDGSGGGLEVAEQQSQSAQATGDRGKQLAAKLTAVVPAGYESPDGLTGVDGKPLKHDYPVYDAATGEDVESWAYTAAVPLRKGKGIGELSVTVFGPDKDRTARAGCQVNPMAMNPERCHEIVVEGRKVGVFTSDIDGNPVQTAVIQYDDSTVVTLTQAAGYRWAGVPKLPGLPFSAEQLAGLTADPEFKIQ